MFSILNRFKKHEIGVENQGESRLMGAGRRWVNCKEPKNVKSAIMLELSRTANVGNWVSEVENKLCYNIEGKNRWRQEWRNVSVGLTGLLLLLLPHFSWLVCCKVARTDKRSANLSCTWERPFFGSLTNTRKCVSFATSFTPRFKNEIPCLMRYLWKPYGCSSVFNTN